MFTLSVKPRFGELDALGHINHGASVVWFELARNPIFEIFDPTKEVSRKTFSLILVHSDYDYVEQLFYKYDVEIKTWIKHIGNKSFTICHEAWQNGRLCIKCNVVLVHYDFTNEKSTPIPEDKKLLLAEHLI